MTPSRLINLRSTYLNIIDFSPTSSIAHRSLRSSAATTQMTFSQNQLSLLYSKSFISTLTNHLNNYFSLLTNQTLLTYCFKIKILILASTHVPQKLYQFLQKLTFHVPDQSFLKDTASLLISLARLLLLLSLGTKQLSYLKKLFFNNHLELMNSSYAFY